MQFIKMHGAGNDYVYLDLFQHEAPANADELARQISDRHKGVGGDGLVFISAPDDPSSADAKMVMRNADGSVAEMCGNALRCVAKHVHDHVMKRPDRIHVETGNGTLAVDVVGRDAAGLAERLRVDMGRPILEAADIPTSLEGNPPVEMPLDVDTAGTHLRSSLTVTCVSMGNPHAVAFVDRLTDELVHFVGPRVENHPAFPNRVNTEFVVVKNRGEFDMRVWERGSGETQACGTGACAVAVAGVLSGRMDRKVVGHLPGGDLELEWTEEGAVLMTGPAAEVFRGDWPE